MDNKEFWTIVESLNWNEDKNYNKHKKRLLLKYDEKILEELQKMTQDKISILSKKLNSFEKISGNIIGLGDDSFNDFCCEIVGRGEKFYNNIIREVDEFMVSENKEISALKMAHNYDFTESFWYCIPHQGDQKLVNLNHYKEQYEKFYTEFMENFDLSDFNDEIKAKGNALKLHLDEAYADLNYLMVNSDEVLSLKKFIDGKKSSGTGAWLENIVFDYKNYMQD